MFVLGQPRKLVTSFIFCVPYFNHKSKTFMQNILYKLHIFISNSSFLNYLWLWISSYAQIRAHKRFMNEAPVLLPLDRHEVKLNSVLYLYTVPE